VGVDAPELPLSAHIWLDMQGEGNPHFLRLHPEATAGQRSAFDQQIWQLLEHEAQTAGTASRRSLSSTPPPIPVRKRCSAFQKRRRCGAAARLRLIDDAIVLVSLLKGEERRAKRWMPPRLTDGQTKLTRADAGRPRGLGPGCWGDLE
jgi:hypothetical protein